MMSGVTENCSDLPHLTTREVEALYSSSLYSILHRLGIDRERTTPPQQQVFLYLQNVLDMSKDNHENHLDAVKQMEPPMSVLTVTVGQAKGLIPMDSNGLSDPFCMMGCIPSDHMRRDVASKSCMPKDTRAFLLEKHLTPELVKVTSVKKKTLDPEWDEIFQFELDANMITDHVLQVEIWDHDEATTMFKTVKTISNVPNIKSMRRFFKEVAKTSSRKGSESMNDIQGIVMIPLNEIPSHGTEEWLTLHGKTPRKKYGEIKIKFSWTHKSFEYATHVVSPEQALQTLWYKSVHYEVTNKGLNKKKATWDGQLSAHGKSLLGQYAVQHSLSRDHQAMSQWIAYSQPCCIPHLEYKTLLAVLQQLSGSSSFKVQESDKFIIRGCLYRFINVAVSQLQKQRLVFPCREVDAMVQLSIVLKCLNETAILDKSMELGLYQTGITPCITAAVKSDICEGYPAMKSDVRNGVPAEDTCREVTTLARLTERLKVHLGRDIASMAHVYEQVMKINYKDILHRQLGELLMHDVRSALDDASRTAAGEDIDASSSLFQLYQALKAFHEAYSCGETRDDPTPTAQFYLVFSRIVKHWFSVTTKQSLERIHKAVELDMLIKMDSVAKHSTSAVDVIGCITVIVDFWNKLGWPDPAGAYVFATSVTDDICQCSLAYGHHIHDKLTAHGFYDTEGRFDVSNELCIAINNLEQLREHLTDLFDDLHLDKVVADLEPELGNASRVKCEKTLRTMLESADEDMLNTIGRIVCHASELMKADVDKCLENVVRAPDNISAEQVVVPILEYMDSNLTTLHSLVMENNFRRILGELWLLVLKEIHTMVEERKMKLHQQLDIVNRIKDTLKILQDLFYADGDGLSLELMQGDEYASLRSDLENFLTPTPDLILNVFQAKILEQEEVEDEPLGRFSFRLCYDKRDELLLVEVMNATNLTPLDANGQSDPYVKVQLKPIHLFPEAPVMKTHTEKKTLHPIFDEKFKFHVPASQCLTPGACVHFRILDHDVIGRSDVEGEIFAALNEVKGLDDSFNGKIDDLPVHSYPLMKSVDQDDASQILESLQCREKDKEAREFWNGWTKRHRQADS